MWYLKETRKKFQINNKIKFINKNRVKKPFKALKKIRLKQSIKSSKRPFKLKKKFRFWRFFKRFFMFRLKIKKISNFQWMYNNHRILKHQFNSLYGSKLKNFLFVNRSHGGKKIHFFNFLQQNELKLYIFLIRTRLCFKLIDSLLALKNKQISVNYAIKTFSGFYLNPQDLVQKCRIFVTYTPRVRKHIWRHYRWRFVKNRLKFRNPKFTYLSVYVYNKKNQIINYCETNYNILSSILVRYPLLSELLLNYNFVFFKAWLWRKLYFIY